MIGPSGTARVRRPIGRSGRLIALAIGLPLALLHAGPATARQQSPVVLRGVVLDSAGVPAEGRQIVLHRVSDSGGTPLSQTVTNASGRFELRGEAAPGDAVYFAAVRDDGRLHVGAMLRQPFPPGDYVLRLDAASAAPDPATLAPPTLAAPEGPDTEPSRRQLVFVAAAAVFVIGCAFAIALSAGGPSRKRRLLIRLAEIEELGSATGGRERRRLIEELRSD